MHIPEKTKAFNYRQVYVGLSRATSLHGLFILGQIENRHVKVNPKVVQEYKGSGMNVWFQIQ